MNEASPDPARARGEMQAFVASGLAFLRRADYWLIHIREPELARPWLAQLIEQGLVHSAADLSRSRTPEGRIRESVALSFSHAGLEILGCSATADEPFPSAFSKGMGSASRGRLLGDWDGSEAIASQINRSAWRWSDAKAPDHAASGVHLLVMHFRHHDAPESTLRFVPPSAAQGMSAIKVRGCPSYLQPSGERILGYEPFGFRDGMGQPNVVDLREPKSQHGAETEGVNMPDTKDATHASRLHDNDAALGEFVLGQINGYGEPSQCPDVQGWPAQTEHAPHFAHHASYLAVRQIEQFVDNFLKHHNPDAASPTDAEKMMGRMRGDQPHPLSTGTEAEDFRLRLDDPVGFGCPRGAHIRRANPRDSLGADVKSGVASNSKHRLLRRGRTYSDAPLCGDGSSCGDNKHRGVDCGKDVCGTGLMFIACNADLERQFEFVQQRWIMNPRFPDLANEDDPLLGHRRRFTIQASPCGRTLQGLEPFTRTVGGGYFLLPGLTALRFLARLAPRPVAETSVP